MYWIALILAGLMCISYFLHGLIDKRESTGWFHASGWALIAALHIIGRMGGW